MNVFFLTGCGAVDGSWAPVHLALKRVYPQLRDPPSNEGANFAMARLVYLLRFAHSSPRVPQQPGSVWGSDLHAKWKDLLMTEHQAIRCAIAESLEAAVAAERLRARPQLKHVVDRFVCPLGKRFKLVTTNWDQVVDRALEEQLRGRCTGIEVLHLHGSIADPATLYLPSEVTAEPYRPDGLELQIAQKHDATMKALAQSHRLVIYGCSLSSLDPELSVMVGASCEGAPLQEIFIVDIDPLAVAERLHVSCGRLMKLPRMRCFHPDRLDQELAFP